MRRRWLLPGLAAVLLVAGCGRGSLLHTKGRIVKSGQPFLTQAGEGMRITFVPTDGSRNGRWDSYPALYHAEDGSFEVTGKDGRGLPPGDYRVSLEWLKNRNDLFKGAFGQANSPIVCQVDGDTDEVLIDIDQYPRTPAKKPRPAGRGGQPRNAQARGAGG
jgi:hypothetical protein